MKEERHVNISCAVASLLYLHCPWLVWPQTLVPNPISYAYTALHFSGQGEVSWQSYKPASFFLTVLEPTPITCRNTQSPACSAESWATDNWQGLKAAQTYLSHMDSVRWSTDSGDSERRLPQRLPQNTEPVVLLPWDAHTLRRVGHTCTHTYIHPYAHTLRQVCTRPFFTTSSSSLPLTLSWKRFCCETGFTLNMLIPGCNMWWQLTQWPFLLLKGIIWYC